MVGIDSRQPRARQSPKANGCVKSSALQCWLHSLTSSYIVITQTCCHFSSSVTFIFSSHNVDITRRHPGCRMCGSTDPYLTTNHTGVTFAERGNGMAQWMCYRKYPQEKVLNARCMNRHTSKLCSDVNRKSRSGAYVPFDRQLQSFYRLPRAGFKRLHQAPWHPNEPCCCCKRFALAVWFEHTLQPVCPFSSFSKLQFYTAVSYLIHSENIKL